MKYQNLSFSLKNGFVKNSIASSENDLPTTTNPENSEFPLPLIIGEGYLPFILIHQKFLNSEKFYEGYIEIKSRNVELVGYLKLKILISDSEISEENHQKFGNFFNKKYFDCNKDSIEFDKNNKNLLDRSYPVSYTDYDPLTIKKYFLNFHDNYKINEEEISLSERILLLTDFNNLKPGDFENFVKIYKKSIEEKISLLLYQVLQILSEFSEKQKELEFFSNVEKFLKTFEDPNSDKNTSNANEFSFTQIHNLFSDNLYVIKNYVTFLYNYEKHYQANKVKEYLNKFFYKKIVGPFNK